MAHNILNQADSLLLIIDIQEKLLKAQPKAEKIVKKASILAQAANILNIPVVVSEQYPQGLGSTQIDVKNSLPTSAEFFEKTAFNCLEQDGFSDILKKYKKKQIIICGIESHVCVHQTVGSLLKSGYEAHVAQDAIGSRDKYEHKLGIERMIQNGATVTCTEIVLFELLKNAKHPDFKQVQTLIK